MKYSIVIPTYTYPIEKCLESVLKYTTLEDTEIIVVANGIPQEKWEYLDKFSQDMALKLHGPNWRETHYPSKCGPGSSGTPGGDYYERCEGARFRVITVPQPIGYVKAVNLGIAEAKGEFIILMNDDVEILPSPVNQWIETLNKPFTDPKVAVTGPHMNWSPSAQYPFLIFFLVMLRKSVLDEIGVLDEALSPGYNDDVDICIRARKAGYKVLQVPDDTPLVQDNVNQIAIANFPVYHKAEGTFDHYAGWDGVLAKNHAIMAERYGPKVDKAEMVEGAMGSSEVLFLAREARDAKIIIEVGSWKGRSTRALADNCPGTVYAVDHWAGSADEPLMIAAAAGDAAFKAFQGNLADHIDSGKVKILRMSSDEAAKVLKDNGVKADMIFIDGEHTFEQVAEDIKNYTPLLAEGGLLCGHDMYVREGVTRCVTMLFKKFTVAEGTTIWGVRREDMAAPDSFDRRHVTCFILTKGRQYSTLPLSIASVAMQTRPPDHLILYDDGKEVDIRTLPVFQHLFKLLEEKHISWEIVWANGRGYEHGYAHNLSQEKAKDLVWRVDDDEYAEPNVLEELLSHMTEGVGAVAGLVVVPPVQQLPADAGNLIVNLDAPNIQWFKWDGEPKSAEHLHSSFLYRAKLVNFSDKSTVAGHREETIFSHTLFRMGYKLLVTPKAVTWHFRNPEGGLRSLKDQSLWDTDQKMFEAQLKEWGYEVRKDKTIYLDSGLGDHLVFSRLVPILVEKYGKLLIACCYPEVFKGMDNLTLISIAEGQRRGVNPKEHDIYAWMDSRGWKRPLIEAYEGMYL